MNKIISWTLTTLLVVGSAATAPNARSLGRNLPTATPAPRAADDLLAVLPKSDVVVVLDVQRLVRDLLPKIKEAWPEQFAKFEKDFTADIAKAKIDIYKVKTLSLGLKLFGDNTTGAMIVEGITLTPEMMTESVPVSYKGKTLYLEKPKPAETKTPAKGKPATPAKAKAAPKGDAAGSKGLAGVGSVGASLLKDKTALVQVDAERIAVGDEAEVKAIVDALTGSPAPTNNVSSALSAALKETNATALLRFAVSIPDNVRQMAAGDEFLKNLAVTQMAMGTLDISAELSLSLDAKLRTGSAAEATKLHEALAALLGLAKMMLGGNQDPIMQMLNKMLDQIKLSPQANDVSLGLTVPQELYETFLKSEPKAAPPKNDK